MRLYGLDIGDLNEPARLLVDNSQTLDAAGNEAPEVPHAGPSTALIGDGIAALAQAMSDLVVSSARAAHAVQDCDEGYAATEYMNGAAIADAADGTR